MYISKLKINKSLDIMGILASDIFMPLFFIEKKYAKNIAGFFKGIRTPYYRMRIIIKIISRIPIQTYIFDMYDIGFSAD